MASIARLDNRTRSIPQTDLLSAAFEFSPQGLAIVEDGQILYANPAFARLFSSSSVELEGTAVASLLPDVPESGVGSDAREARTGPKSAPPLLLEISSSSLNWNQRQLRVLALRDLSEHHRIVQKERQESRDREIALRLTHRLAQDLNRLLSAITLSSDVVAEGLEVGRRPRLHVEKIRSASRRGESLMRQLLAIVGPEAASIPPTSRPTSDMHRGPALTVLNAPSSGMEESKKR